MSCPNELTLSIYAEGELSAEEARHVVAHVETCAECRAMVTGLERENAVLRSVLGEEEAVAVGLTGVAPAVVPSQSSASASSWLWGAIAAAAFVPLMLQRLWQSAPSLPPGLAWLGNFGGVGEMFSLSRGLTELTVGGQDMLVSSFGFGATLLVVFGALGVATLGRPRLSAASAGLVLALFAGFAPASPAYAAEFRYQEEGTVKVDAGESIDDTVFLGGKTAIIAGTVDGDVFAAAERVEVTGTVHGNLFSAGETVTIAGQIDGNLHAAGKNVDVDAKVGGTGFLAGQNVNLNEAGQLARGGFFAGESVRTKGQVGRDLYLAGEKLEVSGSVARSVRAYGERFAVSSTGVVEGDVHVTVPSEDAVEIDEGATVKGETVVDIEVEDERPAFVSAAFYFGVLGKALALLLIGVLLVMLFPALRPSAPGTSREVLRDMGIGFIVLLAVPVAMFLIALTLIGVPVSMLLAVAYALVFYLSTLVVAYFIAKRFAPEDDRRLVLWTGLILLAILFVVEIPFIGGGLNFLVHIFGMGCLVLHLWNLYQASRESTDTPPIRPGVLAPE
jgi:cytoskeletal protein CcmA (bactofilin family)